MEPSLPIETAGGLAIADGVSMRRWFAGYAAMLLISGAVLAWLLAGSDLAVGDWTGARAWGEAFARIAPAAKLVALAMYLSLCCTFLPLPTGWIVAAAATREAAVAGGLWPTVALVAAAGAVGSTIANLNDYHLFTWLLRHHRIGKVRLTRAHATAARWFAASPMLLLLIVNIVPIPIDVVRPLAATCRYGRVPFAAANFTGRFVRYGVIAMITYTCDLGWRAVVALLALAGVLVLARAAGALVKRLRPARHQADMAEDSDT